MKGFLGIVLFICIIFPFTSQEATLEQTPDKPKNKSITELVKQQTDTIKKIVESQRHTVHLDYPLVTKHDGIPDSPAAKNNKDDSKKLLEKKEKERQSIEDLRLRCQHFFADIEKSSPTSTSLPTVEPFGPPIKPEFLKKPVVKPEANINKVTDLKETSSHESNESNDGLGGRNVVKLKEGAIGYKDELRGNYFIFEDKKEDDPIKEGDIQETVQATTEKMVSIPPKKTLASPIKNVPNVQLVEAQTAIRPAIIKPDAPHFTNQIRYEPLVLQKTLLTNGKNLFYWYRPITQMRNRNNLQEYPYEVPANVNPSSTPKLAQLPVESVTKPITWNHNHVITTARTTLGEIPPSRATTVTATTPRSTIETTKRSTISEASRITPIEITTQKPTTQKPTTQNPTTQKPTTQKPTTQKPTTQKPTPPPTKTTPQVPNYEIIYGNLPKPDRSDNIYRNQVPIGSNANQHVSQNPNVGISNLHVPNLQIPNEVPYVQNPYTYRSELRFILPFTYTPEVQNRFADYPPSGPKFDPYAYYPRHLQPTLMTQAVPYVPTFHMIRTLSIPNESNEHDDYFDDSEANAY